MRVSRTLHRSLDRFRDDPASVRNAAWLIIGATVVAVVAGALVVRFLDEAEYPHFGRALWFTLQTVTTVGYGDVTPTTPLGRVVGGVVMLTAIGFITIVTAAITSTFVEAARRRADQATDAADAETAEQTQAAIAAITTRLDKIEATLQTIVAQTRPS